MEGEIAELAKQKPCRNCCIAKVMVLCGESPNCYFDCDSLKEWQSRMIDLTILLPHPRDYMKAVIGGENG